MIELKFYRDDEYVYINNPDGTTKRVAIEDFESAISGDGGSGSGGEEVVMVVNNVYNTLDATWNEIKTAVDANKIVAVKKAYEEDGDTTIIYSYVSQVLSEPSLYTVQVLSADPSGAISLKFTASSADGYPTFRLEE